MPSSSSRGTRLNLIRTEDLIALAENVVQSSRNEIDEILGVPPNCDCEVCRPQGIREDTSIRENLVGDSWVGFGATTTAAPATLTWLPPEYPSTEREDYGVEDYSAVIDQPLPSRPSPPRPRLNPEQPSEPKYRKLKCQYCGTKLKKEAKCGCDFTRDFGVRTVFA